MTTSEDSYWLDLAVSEFGRSVWERGLSKFAEDMEVGEDPEIFTYSAYSITVSRPTTTNISITLQNLQEDEVQIVVLLYFYEYRDLPPETMVWEVDSSIELLESVSGLWMENLFTLNKS